MSRARTASFGTPETDPHDVPIESADLSPEPDEPPLWNSRPVTLLLDPEGRLIRHVSGGTHDREVRLRAGTPIRTLFPDPDDRWTEWLARLHRDPGSTVHVNLQVPHRGQGTAIPMRRSGTAIPIQDPQGELAQIAVHLEPAHEVRGPVVPKEEQFRLLAETLPHMVWIARLDGAMEYFSPQWAAFTGTSVDDLLTHGIHGYLHPDDIAAMSQATPDADGTYRLEPFRLRRHDGEYRWVEAFITSVHHEDGSVWRLVGSTSDITERLAAEHERRELAEQLAAALSAARLGRFTTDVVADRAQVDQRFMDILGLAGTPERLTRRSALLAQFPPIHSDDVVGVQAAFEASQATGAPFTLEFRVMRPGASGGPQERWISVLARPEIHDGDVVGMVGVIGDVTDRRAEDAARLRSQKREALGTLAGGIAHDFNNVIGAILSNAALAEAEIAAGESPATSLAEIRRGAERAGDVVRRLLGFSHEGDHREEHFDVAEVAREACELLRPTLAPGVRLSPPGGSAPPVLGSSSELHQVVVNLIGNAGHAAADGGGTIGLEIDVVSAGALRATATPGDPVAQLPDGDYVRLQVSDDGAGIAPAILTRIFDPFFTTKASGEGTGLGLAAAQAIVRNHGGEITAANRQPPHRGAVLTVVLPVADAQAMVADAPSPPTASTGAATNGARPHVLFVDDEAPLARLAARAFPLHGCTVDVFTDPVAALAAFQAAPERFDVMVTDLSMPHLSGLELADEVLTLRPELPVILSSGYVTRENRAAAIDRGIREVIPKPCALEEIADVVLRLAASVRSGARP